MKNMHARAAFVVAAIALWSVACTPPEPNTGEPPGEVVRPEAAMDTVLAESIDEVRPSGVTFDQSFESFADGTLVRFNMQRWHYLAPNEPALLAAAAQLRDAAVADGWTLLANYADPGASGKFKATLDKAPMRLTLRYVTSAAFDLDPADVDELRLTGEIVYDPSRENGGGS